MSTRQNLLPTVNEIPKTIAVNSAHKTEKNSFLNRDYEDNSLYFKIENDFAI